MYTISKWFIFLSKLGCSGANSHEEAKRVRLSNNIFLVYFTLLITYVPIFEMMGVRLLSLIIMFLSMVIIFCLYLNNKTYYLTARSLFIFIISIPIYWFAGILGPNSAVQITIFVTMTISFVLFNDNQTAFKYFFVLMQIAIYALLELTNYAFFYKINLPDSYLQIFRNSVILYVFIIIFFTLKYYSTLMHDMKNSISNLSKLQCLTDRESEIILLCVEGKSNKQIADSLFIELSTVKTHLSRVFKKLNITNRTQLASLISPSSEI